MKILSPFNLAWVVIITITSLINNQWLTLFELLVLLTIINIKKENEGVKHG